MKMMGRRMRTKTSVEISFQTTSGLNEDGDMVEAEGRQHVGSAGGF